MMEDNNEHITITTTHRTVEYAGILCRDFIEYNNEKYISIKAFCDAITNNKTTGNIFRKMKIGRYDYYNDIQNISGGFQGQEKLNVIYDYIVYGKSPRYESNEGDCYCKNVDKMDNNNTSDDFSVAFEPLSKYMENSETFSINHKLEIIKKLSTIINELSGL